ncbi:hypothetical protein SCLCIDRAFT_29146 [Scleroderma citrinum Foug A]|uniref:Uncharacterized protein n=1 Tax=Scleroderma citrinum Foug A TaxID=1036808 RepID=A0A0C2Z596_9AGAM|nr:hypothetical protein SCLCIDRAFT_29146 [Scleroderma citrinum Foug A]
MTQHRQRCPHYQEQFCRCWQFLRDAASVNPHESLQGPPAKCLKTNSSNESESVVQSQAVQNTVTSVLQLPSGSSVPLSPEAPVAPSSSIPELEAFSLNDRHDLLPQLSPPSNSHPPDPPPPVDPAPPSTFLPQVILHVFDSFCTSFNRFGIAHEYQHRPSYDPEHNVPAQELAKPTDDGTAIGSDMEHKPPPWPWLNMSIWRLLAWQLTGNGKKSSAETTRLVHDVLLANDFKLEDLSGFNVETAIKNMDKSEAALALDCQSTGAPEWDGWKTNVDVKIQVPLCEKCSKGTGKTFTVPDLAYRLLVSVIRAAFTNPVSQWFHLTPFKCIWKSPVTGREQ